MNATPTTNSINKQPSKVQKTTAMAICVIPKDSFYVVQCAVQMSFIESSHYSCNGLVILLEWRKRVSDWRPNELRPTGQPPERWKRHQAVTIDKNWRRIELHGKFLRRPFFSMQVKRAHYDECTLQRTMKTKVKTKKFGHSYN